MSPELSHDLQVLDKKLDQIISDLAQAQQALAALAENQRRTFAYLQGWLN